MGTYIKYGLKLVTIIVVLIMIGACSAPNGDVEKGSRWYAMHNCSSCHGPHGNDGKAPEIRNLEMSFRSFLSTIRDAGSPIMPKFPEEKISKQDAADIYAWLTRK